MEWIVGILGGFGILLFGWSQFKDLLIKKDINKLIDQNNTNNNQLQQDIKTVEVKEEKEQIDEAKVDQQLLDLKDQKVDDSDIANFIDSMEKKSNEKN